MSAPGPGESVDTTGGEEVSLQLATRIWMLLAGLVTQSILARFLAPDGRGEFAVCLMFGTMLGVVLAPGTDRGAQYFVMSRRFSVSLGVSVGIVLSLLGSLLAVALGLGLIGSSFPFFSKADPAAFRLALALIPATVLSTSLQLQLAGLRRFASLGIFTVLQNAANVGGMIVCVWVLGWGVNGALLAQTLSTLLLIALFGWDLRRNCGFHLEWPRWRHFAPVLRYGLKYHVARIGSMLDFQVGALFLAMLASRAEIGYFAAASALILRLLILSDSIESSLLPRIAADARGRPGLVGQCGRLSGAASALALGLLVALSVPLVRLLFSDAFLPSVPLIWILAPGLLVYAGAKVLMAYFRATNRPEVCSWVVWTGLSVNVGLLLVLYPRIGLPAAAWAMTAGLVCRSLFLVIAFRRVSGESFRSTWAPRADDLVWVRSSARAVIARVLRAGGAHG